MAGMTRFPADTAGLTTALLTEVLSEMTPGVSVAGVDIVETSQCGDGRASTADRVVVGLEYKAGGDQGLPARMMLKTMLGRPHAPAVMYGNEVRFYREIRPELTIEAPRGFGSMFDPESGRFGILMEDLSLRSAQFPNATTQVSLQAITALLQNMAALHASYWNSPRFADDLSWIPTPRKGGMSEIFESVGLELIKDQVAKHPFKAELIAPLGRSLDELWERLETLLSILDSQPTTLLHGDPHIANTYLLPNDKGGLLDWQLMVRGRWSHDFTYLMVTGMPSAMRRDHERDLLALYLDSLARHGVATPPPREQAWLLYRQSVLWGLVIGWLITPPQNYGEAITAANLQRLVTAMLDLETWAALG